MTGTPLTLTNPASLWAQQSLLADDLSVLTWVGCDGRSWPLSGGMAPIPPQEGVILEDIQGLHGPFTHLDQQGAHQDGVDWLDTVYDKAEIDMTLTFQGATAAGRRRVFRQFLAGWDPKRTGRLVWFTQELGEWWITLRMLSEPRDVLKAGDSPSVTMKWAARADLPFWSSFDSVSPKWVAAGGSGSTFLPLWNRGDQDGWPRYLAQGPGTFTFGDNGVGTRTISITLPRGQTALIPSLPNKNRITDVASGAYIFPLLRNRFATPIPAGAAVHVPVTVTGATAGVTSVLASLTPYRRWPE